MQDAGRLQLMDSLRREPQQLAEDLLVVLTERRRLGA
jgi:hypothetical protein